MSDVLSDFIGLGGRLHQSGERPKNGAAVLAAAARGLSVFKGSRWLPPALKRSAGVKASRLAPDHQEAKVRPRRWRLAAPLLTASLDLRRPSPALRASALGGAPIPDDGRPGTIELLAQSAVTLDRVPPDDDDQARRRR